MSQVSIHTTIMWRTRFSRTWNWLRSRKLVGEDEHHLFYTEFIEEGKPERRYVEYKDSDITQSSDRMHIEWWSWLHNRRDSVPTAEEIAHAILKQERLKANVARIEAEDEKQRLRQFAGGKASSPEDVAERRKRKAFTRLEEAASYGTGSPVDTREQWGGKSRAEKDKKVRIQYSLQQTSFAKTNASMQ